MPRKFRQPKALKAPRHIRDLTDSQLSPVGLLGFLPADRGGPAWFDAHGSGAEPTDRTDTAARIAGYDAAFAEMARREAVSK